MPREAIAEENYITEIERLLNEEGLRIEEITVSKIQQTVGGRYNRAAEIVARFKDEYKKRQQEEKDVPVASWFREAITASVDSVHGQLEGLWLTLHKEMDKIIAVSREAYEQEKVEQAAALEEAKQVIDGLENKVEEDETLLQDRQASIEMLSAQKSDLETRLDVSEKAKTIADSNLSNAKEQVAVLQTQNTDLQKNLDSQIENYNSYRDKKSEEVEKLKTDLNEKKAVVSAKKTEIEGLEKQIIEAKEKIQADEQVRDELKEEVMFHASSEAALLEKNEALQAKLENAGKLSLVAKEKEESARDTLQKNEIALATTSTKVDELNKRVDSLEKTNEKLVAQMGKATK
jgi:chromosome segregation ATPase